MLHRRELLAAAGAAAATGFAGDALAQAFPSRAIKLVVMPSDKFGAHIAGQYARYSKVIDEAGLKA